MESKKRFSASAIILIILLSFRFISQIIIFFLLIPGSITLTSLVYLGMFALLALFYGISLIGVIKKTSWGIKFVIAIAILDIILTFILDIIRGAMGNVSSIGAIVVDILLIVLAGNISKHMRR